MTSSRPPLLAADHIRELTRPITDTVNVDTRRVPVPTTLGPATPSAWTHLEARQSLHTVTHPSLLDQLGHALTGSTAGMVMGGESGSKPAARLDALAVLQRIDRESAERAHAEGIEALPLLPRLSRLAGTVPDHDTQVRSWWTAARLVTSWDTPPFAPRVPCPNDECERRGALRIRVDEWTAICVECGDYWPPEDMPRLTDYVQWAAEHLTGPRHWLTDDDGYPSECTDCLATRQQMAERSMARSRSVLARRDTQRAAS